MATRGAEEGTGGGVGGDVQSKGKGKANGKRGNARDQANVDTVSSVTVAKGKGKANGKRGADGGDIRAKGKGKGQANVRVEGGVILAKGKGKGKGKGKANVDAEGGVINGQGKGQATGKGGANDCVIPAKGRGKGAMNGQRVIDRSCSSHQPSDIPTQCSRKGAKGNRKDKWSKNKKHQQHPSGPAQCAICQENINGARAVLDCMHTFHKHCSSQCVPHIRRAGCPICRQPSPHWLRSLSAAHRNRASPPTSDYAESDLALDSDADSWTAFGLAMLDADSHADYDNDSDSSASEPRRVVVPDTSFLEDLYDDYQYLEEIERLREDFPDLGSDALEDLREARIQEDCEEFAGYCSDRS